MSRRLLTATLHGLQRLTNETVRQRCGFRSTVITSSLRALFIFFVLTASRLPAQELNHADEWQRVEKYFDGLRSRGLYSLAETVCHRKLAEQGLDLTTRTRYSVELSQSLTEHSHTAPTPDQQTELLQQARQAVSVILENQRNHPQQILLESQLAFVTASELESLRWQVALSPFDRQLIDRAQQLADSLIATLQRLEEQAQEQEQARDRRTDVMNEKLLPHQLRSLQRTIQLRLGTALLDKAQLFPESTSDRADALVKASEVLRQLAAIASNDQTMWQSQLAYTTTLRLRGTPAAAWSMINAMREDNPPAAIQEALAVEHVELLIAEDRYPDAADFLRQQQTEQRRLSGPLGFLTARVYLRLSQIATEKNRPELAAELLKEVHRTIEIATSTGNSYWATRARNLLADEESRNTYGAEIGTLVREGQALFASGNSSAAAQRYAQAFAAAREKKAEEAAAEIGYTYGSILLNQKQFSEATEVFRQVKSLHTAGPRAAEADLLAAWCLGMMFRDTPSSERLEAYVAALEQHRTTHAGSVTASEATWMLAQLQEQRLQTTQALSLYVSIPNTHLRYRESTIGIARCSETILDRLRRLNKSRSEWEPAIVDLLAPYIREAMDPLSPPTPEKADFLVRTSRILIALEQPDFETADTLLSHVLTAASNEEQQKGTPWPQDTVETAAGLRIISLTGLGRTEDAINLLKSTVLLNRERLKGILNGLSSMADVLTQDQLKSVGEIQLAAVKLAGLKVQSLSDDELEKFGPVVATAFEQTGQFIRAIEILIRLLDNHPRDADMRRRVALLYLKTGRPADVAAAQLEFRKLEGSLKAGSDLWMDARIHVIEAAITLENFDEARKLLKVTQLLYPNPKNDDLKRRLSEASAALASAN